MAFRFSAEFSDSPQYIGDAPRHFAWTGVELITASEDIQQPTVWKIKEDRHALIVHLDGTINQIETEIDHRASKLNPPVAGEIMLIPANSEYFTFTSGKTVSYAELYFETDFLKNFIGEKADEYELLPQIGIFDPFIHQNAEMLIAMANSDDDISALTSASLIQTICLSLFRNYAASSPDLSVQILCLPPGKFKLLQSYIFDNLSEHLTLEKLSSLAEMSEDKLLRVFRHSFGVTPAQYIINQRLRRAQWMLSKTKKDITTIALETGFSSHSHLTTAFKKQTGMTPHQFRSLM